ncbi:FAD-dependent oxidoreductase [Nocardia yamanashiensis]|uniref:FAD-dependent oxidoreductase n=1 Tax=Nocardia yamanashiensis TaxID=209247 RepID=UPI001E3113D1|nr:FAD-dependent oxidoreductase [Nocardia yamanashiensis]UGT43710.1 FAD-dependent oxidoreductase [Nocardia yamanashiensis]
MTSSDLNPVDARTCDVCVVGAGIAGLNALFVASRYLRRDQKIILVDRHPRAGGMWVDAYPYVRLHQPHPLFTAGDIKWTIHKERSYLATRTEVLEHFAHCVRVIGERVQVEEYFGVDYRSHEETAGGVRITCTDADGRPLVIMADKLIKAFGVNVAPKDPLTVSSDRVRSVSPNYCDVRSGEIADSDEPVWIIGGGKTAMDTASALIAARPDREVNLVAGPGTVFLDRDRIVPPGPRRYWGGLMPNRLFIEVARKFDGTNENEVQAWLLANAGLSVTPQADNFFAGLLSEAEQATIRAGLHTVVMGHLRDAVDRNGAVDLVFRNGDTVATPAGSWIVNCTGYLLHTDTPYEPYVSPGGQVLSIQTRSATFGFLSFGGYFLTHLMFRDKLREVPLFAFDGDELRKKTVTAAPLAYAALTLHLHNLSLIYEALGPSVFLRCGLDFDRWYPLHRRMVDSAYFARTHRRDREHQRQTLETMAERFGMRCAAVVGD